MPEIFWIELEQHLIIMKLGPGHNVYQVSGPSSI